MMCDDHTPNTMVWPWQPCLLAERFFKVISAVSPRFSCLEPYAGYVYHVLPAGKPTISMENHIF